MTKRNTLRAVAWDVMLDAYYCMRDPQFAFYVLVMVAGIVGLLWIFLK